MNVSQFSDYLSSQMDTDSYSNYYSDSDSDSE
jgi:hypothetical protein